LEEVIFVLSDDATTVDFSTQTAFTGDIDPDGNEVGIFGLEANGWGSTAILVNGNNCVIRGLDRVAQRGYGIQIRGNNNRVIGCTITAPLYAGVYITGGLGGPSPTGNIIGGTAAWGRKHAFSRHQRGADRRAGYGQHRYRKQMAERRVLWRRSAERAQLGALRDQ
jgi:hypothetical protein